jgi:hypothetical protein
MKREFVKIYTQENGYTGRPQYVVIWYPVRGQRKRKTFSDKLRAEEEAGRTEEQMRTGAAMLTTLTREDWVSLSSLFADFPGATLAEVVRVYRERRIQTSSESARSHDPFIEESVNKKTRKQKKTMTEPMSFRPSNSDNPKRGERFEAVLKRVGANPTDVMRLLIDAYIETDGRVQFPIQLVERNDDGNSSATKKRGRQ